MIKTRGSRTSMYVSHDKISRQLRGLPGAYRDKLLHFSPHNSPHCIQADCTNQWRQQRQSVDSPVELAPETWRAILSLNTVWCHLCMRTACRNQQTTWLLQSTGYRLRLDMWLLKKRNGQIKVREDRDEKTTVNVTDSFNDSSIVDLLLIWRLFVGVRG